MALVTARTQLTLSSGDAEFVPFPTTVLIAAAVYIAANLLADIGAILLNPRLRAA